VRRRGRTEGSRQKAVGGGQKKEGNSQSVIRDSKFTISQA